MSVTVRRRLVTVFLAIAAGIAIGLAFPPFGWWPLMPLGLGIFLWLTALRRPRWWLGFGIGYLVGLGFFAVLVRWLLVVEVWPATFALVAVMALWYGLIGAALTVVGRLPAWPLLAGAIWLIVEFVDSRWPLGGFPFGRLSYATAGTPIDGWLPLISASGVSWLIVATTGLAVWAIRSLQLARRRGDLDLRSLWADDEIEEPSPAQPGGAAPTLAPASLAAAPASVSHRPTTASPGSGQSTRPAADVAPGEPIELPVFIADAVRPLKLVTTLGPVVVAWVCFGVIGLVSWASNQYQPGQTENQVTIGVIQGNVPGTGLAAIGPGRTTTYNSLAETIVLAAQVKTGQVAAPDFVLWPESSVAQDPETDLVTASLITTASQIIEAPLLVGAISRSPEAGYRYTTALWWMPDGQVVSHYEKQNIVPFGEWVPLRSLLEPLFPELELVGLQTQAGPGPGIVLGQLTDGRVLPVGVLICFEVGYDDTVDEMLRGAGDLPPAQVTVVQTNNSALTGTGQMAQQDAISQIRALESRRDVVIATTNSLSGWISPDGQHQWQATPERSAATTVTVSLRTGLTPAIAYRQPIEVALVLISVLISGWLTFRHRRSRTQTSTGSSPAVQE